MNTRSLLTRGAARLLLLGVAGTAMADEQQGTDDVNVNVNIAPPHHSRLAVDVDRRHLDRADRE